VTVAGRITAGSGCGADATKILALPGYTTTIGGTWEQRRIFDGPGLVRLRAAERARTPLWFELSVGTRRSCMRLWRRP
jgi:hypothetical protein